MASAIRSRPGSMSWLTRAGLLIQTGMSCCNRYLNLQTTSKDYHSFLVPQFFPRTPIRLICPFKRPTVQQMLKEPGSTRFQVPILGAVSHRVIACGLTASYMYLPMELKSRCKCSCPTGKTTEQCFSAIRPRQSRPLSKFRSPNSNDTFRAFPLHPRRFAM
ncbi:hypothetical protein BKA81DRAFT_196668 [Phyllosticta paracitricarpa]